MMVMSFVGAVSASSIVRRMVACLDLRWLLGVHLLLWPIVSTLIPLVFV